MNAVISKYQFTYLIFLKGCSGYSHITKFI